MTNKESRTWIVDGEKYALIGLHVNFDGDCPLSEVAADRWAMTDAAFTVPDHWREWLGSTRVSDIEASNLFLLSKVVSKSLGVLDRENKILTQRVWTFYVGLLLATTFAPVHEPVMLTGSCEGGEIGIRQQQDYDSPVPMITRLYPPVVPADLKLAGRLAEGIDGVATAQIAEGHWRLFRILNIYINARTNPDALDRLHQYCRCIDGLILPDAGKTKQQFKSRTEIFIGPGHHDLMGNIYEVRSAVEHLHENRYLEKFDRSTRLDLVKKEAIVEHIARTALARLIGDSSLWPHFANTSALSQYWALTPHDRRQIWGNTINLQDALAHFDPQYITDSELGAPESGGHS